MNTQAGKPVKQIEKRVYVEPQVRKAQKLQDVTEGQQPVVTGALPG